MHSGLSDGGRKVPLDLALTVLTVALIVSRLWHLSWPWESTNPWCGDDGTNDTRHKRFLANALWSRVRLAHAGKIQSCTCNKCGLTDESMDHLLWGCSANSMALDKLKRAWIGIEPLFNADMLLADLPACLRICGLVPCILPLGLTLKHVKLLQCYFVEILAEWGRTRDGAS